MSEVKQLNSINSNRILVKNVSYFRTEKYVPSIED